MISLFKVAMNPKVDETLLKTIHSGWIGQGPKVQQFEEALSNRVNNRNCLTLSSGTHGLTLALRLSGVEPGDEVITTPLTCTATNMPILMQGADIVWADVQPDCNIDPKSIQKCITEKTKAIVVVHWGGYPCDMKVIQKIGKDNEIIIIEDAAHAFGSTYLDSKIGDCIYSNFTMMSFQAIKHLTTVDGGCLFTANQGDYKRGKLLRWYGIDREGPRTDFRCEEDIIEWGYKFHMNDVAATIGLSNLEIVDHNLKMTQDNAAYYEEQLKNVHGLKLCQTRKDRLSSSWLFTILVENRLQFCTMMASKGIMTSRVHERNDKHTFAQKYKTQLPGLESIIDKMICIPVGWWVSKEEREHIVNCIKSGW
jgi:dTDP-4-amino-4,6-dideoxygalactose transaminase